MSLNSLDYGCEEHSEFLFPSKCIMRCHQTFSDCVSVLVSVTNDVANDVTNDVGAGFNCVLFCHKGGHACGP